MENLLHKWYLLEKLAYKLNQSKKNERKWNRRKPSLIQNKIRNRKLKAVGLMISRWSKKISYFTKIGNGNWSVAFGLRESDFWNLRGPISVKLFWKDAYNRRGNIEGVTVNDSRALFKTQVGISEPSKHQNNFQFSEEGTPFFALSFCMGWKWIDSFSYSPLFEKSHKPPDLFKSFLNCVQSSGNRRRDKIFLFYCKITDFIKYYFKATSI